MSTFCEIEGRIHQFRGHYDSTYISFGKALDYAREIKDETLEAGAIMGFGVANAYQSNNEKALEYFFQALKIFEKQNKKNVMVNLYGNIGSLYRSMAYLDHAIEYIEKSKKLAEELNDQHGIAYACYNLGAIYFEQQDFEKAVEYESKSLEISLAENNTGMVIHTLQALAKMYAEGLKDYEKAEQCAKECIELSEKYGSNGSIHSALTAMASVCMETKRYKECVEYASKAYNMADSTDYDDMLSLLPSLIASNIHLGEKEDAEHYFAKYVEYTKKYNSESLHNSLTNQDVKYETQKKELRISALEKERTLYVWIGVSIVVILLLAIGLLIYNHRLNRQKHLLSEQKIIQLEQEKKLIATQAALDGEAVERKRMASDLHDGLGGMLTVVKRSLERVEHLQIAREMLDKSIAEMRRIAHYLMPEALIKYGLKTSIEDFCCSIPTVNFHFTGKDLRYDDKIEMLIYRCIYELINNSLKHSGAENINVTLSEEDNTILLTVQDNGCGFDPETVKEGMGMQNLRSRLQIYGGKLECTSTLDNGTKTTIVLNV
jgi:signal transduction histidine kinase